MTHPRMRRSFRVSHRRSEPDVGVGHAGSGYPRETERPDWAGRCDRRRTGEGVPSSDHPSAAEGSSGARGGGGAVRCRWLRQARLEAALSRARTTCGWALTLGRARILRAAPATPGQLAERCGRLRAPGQRRHPGYVTVCNCARDAELSDTGRDPGRRKRCGRVRRRPPGDRGVRNIPVAKPKASCVPVGHHSPPGVCRSKPVTTGIGGGSSGSNSLAGVGRASTGRSTSTAAAAWRRSNSKGDT